MFPADQGIGRDPCHNRRSTEGGLCYSAVVSVDGTIIIAGVHIAVVMIISVPMILFTLACGGGFLLVLQPFNPQSNIFGRALRGSMNDMYSAVTEHLGGMKIAKSYSLEDRHEQNFRNITNGVTDQTGQPALGPYGCK
jgi:ATP-binding cassette, subfamily C, bacterial